MTFNDWLRETKDRYKNQPPVKATIESLHQLRMGGQRRLGGKIGTPVWHREWDVLLVLDACRVDQMEAVVEEYDQLPETVDTVWSQASCSIDWINRTFNAHPDQTKDAGYVTANPFADHNTEGTKSADLKDSNLPYLKLLYLTHWQDIEGETATDSDRTSRAKVGSGIATVPPEPVTDHVIQAWRNRTDHGFNRLVGHYMQPHEPYRAHPEWGSGDSRLLENLVDEDAEAGSSVWPVAKEGHVSTDELWRAGVDNLRWVLDDITERLLPNVEGKVVLTADHGNAMGEWGEWHHPPGAISPAVRKVPWIEIDCTDSQTEIVETETDSVEADITDQLEALGYK